MVLRAACAGPICPTSRNGYGYQPVAAPRVKVKAIHASGYATDHATVVPPNRGRGPTSSHTTQVPTGDTVCSRRFAISPLGVRAADWSASTAW